MFRGVEPAGTGFVMGHEFVGEIVEMGSAVKTLQKGDRVVTAFTTSWFVSCRLDLLDGIALTS
jgi:threonine dehydrogenase-like Zn-dependent dehydrogenase